MHSLLDSVTETEVVGDATTDAEAIAQARALPDVILMPIKMPCTNGIEATPEFVAVSPHISILMVTMFEDDESVFAAMHVGGTRLRPQGREPGGNPAGHRGGGQRGGDL